MSHLWVQAEHHARNALKVLNKTLLDSQPPNVLSTHSANATSQLFDSIRKVLAASKSDEVNLEDLLGFLDGPMYMENMVEDVKEIFGRRASMSSGELISELRKEDSYKMSLRSMEESIRPIHLATLRTVVANIKDSKNAPLASDLLRGFRETTAAYALIENTGIMEKLSGIIGDPQVDESKEGEDRVVYYEELLSFFVLSQNFTSRQVWASHLRVQCLTILGKSLSSEGKYTEALEKLAEARSIVESNDREDFLSSCFMLMSYSDALVAKAIHRGGDARMQRRRKKKGKLSDAMNFNEKQESGWYKNILNALEMPSLRDADLDLADELLTHYFDIVESCFGVNNLMTAKACCSVACLAVIRERYDEGQELLQKAFDIFRKVEKVDGSTIGIGAASASIGMGRLKMKMKEKEEEEEKKSGEKTSNADEDDDFEVGLSEIKYGAEYYRDIGDDKGLALYNELSKIYEKNARCVDFDVVECLENAAGCAINCFGKNSGAAFSALKKLADKCEEGGDFERAAASYKKALRCGEVVYGIGDSKTRRILKMLKKLRGINKQGNGEELGEANEDTNGGDHRGSQFFVEERKAAAEYLAKEELKLKKKMARKKIRKKKKKKKKTKTSTSEVDDDGGPTDGEAATKGGAEVKAVKAVGAKKKVKKKKKIKKASKTKEVKIDMISGAVSAREGSSSNAEGGSLKGQVELSVSLNGSSVIEKRSITESLKVEEADGSVGHGWN